MPSELRWYFADWALSNFCKNNLSVTRTPREAARTLLEVVHHFIVIIRKEGNCNTLLASSTSTTFMEDQKPLLPSPIQRRTDAMNVTFNRVRHLEVDDQRNIGHINTTTRQIGCNENVSLAVAELGKRGFSLLLGLP